MATYIVRRLLQAVPMLLGLSLIVFLLVHAAPGDPSAYFLPENVQDPNLRERVIRQLGLDQPLHIQYWRWLRSALQGDFGFAYSYGRPTLEVIIERLRPTLELQIAAISFSVAFALPIGIISALRRYSLLDHIVTSGSLFGLSMPDFWFGLMLILVFSLSLGWLPSFGTGEGNLVERSRYFVMPVLVLGLATIPWYARFMRSSLLEVMGQDYIRTARAKGLPERKVALKHGVRTALLPVVTIIGLSLPRLVGGSIIVESIFAWPGIGRLAYDSVLRQDIPMILALTLLTGAFVMLVNLAVDMIYTVLDPRIHYN